MTTKNPDTELPTTDGGRFETDRRTFLQTLSIGAAASLAACQRLPVNKAIPYLVPPDSITPGVPVRYASTCLACAAGCGLMVTNLDGRPVKLEGNPAHPLSKGGLCAVGQADLRALYDPTRLSGPALGGKPATWENLDAAVLSALATAKSDGRAVRVLAGTLNSPTARTAIEAFLRPYGGKLVEWDGDPESPSAQREARVALGERPLSPSFRLAEVDRLVVLGADPLGTGPEPVGFTRDYADRKRAAAGGRDFRHLQVEGAMSLTGAAADERWSADAAERRALALALASHFAASASGPEAEGVRGAIPPGVPTGLPPERFRRLVDELEAHRGRSLVLSGSDDPGEQLAVALVNRFLGNEGKTLDPERPSLARRGTDADLAALEAEMAEGRVGVLVVVGCDPVDQLPGTAFAAALAKVPFVVAISDRPTATVAKARGVAAAHHGLECWGDVEVREGMRTLAQPAVRPLFGTRHPFENFLHWSGATSTDWHAQLVEGYRARSGGVVGFETVWNDAVGRGMAPGSAEVVPTATARNVSSARIAAILGSAALAQAAGTVTTELVADVTVRDGSRSHVPWLRELPDPLTRISWMPTVRMAPSRADSLGVADGDLVSVGEGERAVTMAVARVPGMHPSVVALPVGWGRHDGDPDGSARNGWRLASREGGRLRMRGLALSVKRAGGRAALPQVQIEATLHDRPLVHQVASPTSKVESEHGSGKLPSLWPERPSGERKWEMVIDLDACTGCAGCVVACQAENNLPVVGEEEIRRNRDMFWLRIDRYYAGDPASPDVVFEPMLCSQCGNAPCETVCPVAATVHSDDGLNQQAYNRCVGTRYCANNCPYKVRRFNWFDHEFKDPIERLALNPAVVVRDRGVMEKCTFCVQRIQQARIEARIDGRDSFPVETACSQSCPAKAITFGDAADPASEVSKAKKNPRAFQVLAELGVRPGVTYLARVRNRDGVAGPVHGNEAELRKGHEA